LQVWETRANDADSFLLIVATLRQQQLIELIALAGSSAWSRWSKFTLAKQLDRAIAAGARIIGVKQS